MSNPIPPVPVTVVPDQRPKQVIIISHSPLFYWWPVWLIGFLMALVSYWDGDQVAFVPRGTVAEKGARVEGQDGPRDILIAPAGQSLSAASDPGELQGSRLLMTRTNNPGVIWAITLCLVVVITHVKLRGVWSLVAVIVLGFSTVLFAVLGLWDPILRVLGVIDIHMNAFGYLSISLFLFAIWLVTFFVVDRLTYIIITRGQIRVRKTIGEGERVFDMRGMMFERHRDDIFRHWLLGLGTADLTVLLTGATTQQIEMPNVFGVGRKLALINTMIREHEVTKGS
jgi:hypothetical protein